MQPVDGQSVNVTTHQVILPSIAEFCYGTYLCLSETLTLLIHNLIDDFLKGEVCSIGTILLNGLEKMHHVAIVVCRSI